LNKLTLLFDDLTVAYVRQVIRFRWLVLVLSALCCVALGVAIKNTQFNASYKYFFEEDNPHLKAFNELEETFTKLDTTLLVIQPQKESINSPRILDLASEITEKLWATPHTSRVDSIANYQHTYADGDDIFVGSFLEPGSRVSRQRAVDIFEIAETRPELQSRIYSLEHNTLGFIVRANIEPGDNAAFEEATKYVYDLRAGILADHPDIRVAITGLVPRGYFFHQVSIDDMSLLIPVMLFLIIAVMWFLTRSLMCSLIAIALVLLSSGAAMGVGALLGIPITTVSSSAPIIILTIAVADAIHILVSYLIELGKNRNREEALLKSMHLNAKPVLLTSVTTAIGFLSLNFSASPPYRDLGNLAALGVLAAWFLSMTFLPAALAIARVQAKDFIGLQATFFAHITRFITRYRAPLFLAVVVITALSLTLLPRLQFDDDYFKYFDSRLDTDIDSAFIQKNLGGLYTYNYLMPTKAPNGVTEPEYLENLEKFVRWLRQQPEVLNVYSVSDTFKNLNQNMHRDDPAYYRIAPSQDLNAQYLLLYEMSLPYGLDVRDQINIDKSATRVDISTVTFTTQQMVSFAEATDQWVKENLPDYMQSGGTSSGLLFATVGINNFESMKPSTLGAFVLISVCIGVFLGSLKLGVISLLPNTIPIVIVFGMFALTGNTLGVWTPFVISTALGLIVDATVHLLSKYNHARTYDNLDVDASVVYAFSTVGVALLVSTVVLVLGFSSLGFAIVNNLKFIGLGTAAIILVALIVDAMILPMLLASSEKLSPVLESKSPVAVPD
jgi:uncharacterized protein